MTMNQNRWKTTGFIATVVIVLSVPLSLLLNRTGSGEQEPEAVFVGGASCVECHQKEFRLWKGSDHDRAMSVASDSTMLGDFNNAEITSGGVTSRFYKRDGKFYVFTQGPGGEMKEFQLTHTFGVRPL